MSSQWHSSQSMSSQRHSSKMMSSQRHSSYRMLSTRPKGCRPNGTRPKGCRPNGTRPKECLNGTRHKACHPNGSRPKGCPNGTRPKEDLFNKYFFHSPHSLSPPSLSFLFQPPWDGLHVLGMLFILVQNKTVQCGTQLDRAQLAQAPVMSVCLLLE